MFGFNAAKPKNFIEHICSWLLPFLILRGDAADLDWISKVAVQYKIIHLIVWSKLVLM
jgi:ataxia telangiectasia mutated family protein